MSLFERVRELLRRKAPPLAKDAKGAPVDLEVQAAAAVLLLEAAHGDEEYVWREERVLVRGLEHAFGIGRQETQELIGRAEEIRPPVVKLADVTEVLGSRFDLEQRKAVLALLWRVIDADENVAPWEAVFVRHVTQALGLSEAQGEEVRAAKRR
jgi:uncharacterized tellurite resistance protein B-like protein